MPRRIPTDRLNAFLLHFGRSGSVSYAAGRAGLGRSTLYGRKHRDPVFAERWAAAAEQAAGRLQDEAVHRILDGGRKVFRRGRPVGSVRDYDSGLLIALLRGLWPETYARRPAPVMDEPKRRLLEALRLHRRERGEERGDDHGRG